MKLQSASGVHYIVNSSLSRCTCTVSGVHYTHYSSFVSSRKKTSKHNDKDRRQRQAVLITIGSCTADPSLFPLSPLVRSHQIDTECNGIDKCFTK